MEITTELVNHLAELSRLEFTQEETENFKQEFAKTLSQVDKLASADLSKVVLKDEMLDAKNELRPDEKKQGLSVKDVTKNAPDSLGNSILVPVEIV